MARKSNLLVALLPLLPATIACSSANTSLPPTTPEDVASSPLGPGARILISKNNQWLPGNVVRQQGPTFYQVHYDGFGPEWDEGVTVDRIRPQQDPPLARDYRLGEKVLVKVQSRLLLGDVVQQVSPSTWRVHYDGYGPEAAENVGPDRLRRPHSGTSNHGVGELIAVDVGGRALPARVLAIIAADRWLVRFDGFGPEYDQEVGVERIKDAPRPRDPAPPLTPTLLPVATPPVPPPSGDPSKEKVSGKGKDAGKSKDKDAGKSKPLPPEPSNVPAGPLQVGEAVLVANRGAFQAATIAAPAAAGGFRVRYENSMVTGVTEEEIAADRLTRLAPPPQGGAYSANQNVFIESHGVYFAGKVMKESGKGQYKVRFQGSGPEADEIVISKRLRPRP